MKSILLKAVCRTVLAILTLTFFAQISVLAQDDPDPNRENGRKLEGVWNIMVTTRNCATGVPGRTFPAMETYARGGTIIEYALGSATGPNLSGRTTAQGIWHYESNGVYTTALQFFRLGTDGAYTGTTRSVLEISLSDDGNSFTSTETQQNFDTTGTLIQTRCNTRAATRFE